MRSITLQRLQVFCAVYEQNSITAAANQLRLSQPTVSRHLRDFEAALGLSLFILDKGRILATTQADEIYLESQFLQKGLYRLENRIERLREGAGSALSIMSVGLLAAWPLPSAVAELSSELPRLRISVDIGTADQQLSLLRAGLIDLGIIAGDIQAEGLMSTSVGKGHLVAIFPAALPLPKKPTITLEELARLNALPLSPKGPLGRILNRSILEQGLSLTSRIVGNSIVAVPHLAETLRCPAIIDNFTARTLPKDRFKTVLLEEILHFDVQTVTPRLTGAHDIAANTLVQSLQSILKTDFQESISS